MSEHHLVDKKAGQFFPFLLTDQWGLLHASDAHLKGLTQGPTREISLVSSFLDEHSYMGPGEPGVLGGVQEMDEGNSIQRGKGDANEESIPGIT